MARICVIRQEAYPDDPRVRREVEALLAVGHEVDVLCRGRGGQPRRERAGLLNIHRLPGKTFGSGRLGHLLEYALFFILSASVASALHVRRRYDLVQVNSMPDALVFAALIPRLLGARVLLDLHECMPEVYATSFDTGMDHPLVRLIAWLEQRSIRFADFAITCTEQMRQAFIQRGARPDKVDVVLNGADENIFNPESYPQRKRQPNRFTLISHGTIEDRFGLDTAVRAVALLKDRIPGLRLEIYGEGSSLPKLRHLAKDLGVEERVHFSGSWVPLPELVEALANADVGVVPDKKDAFRDLTLRNKMYEFIAMRKPAIVSRTRAVEAYYDASCFQMFSPDDERDLAGAIHKLYANPDLCDRLVERATEVNEPYRWVHQRQVYLQAVQHLLDAGDAPSSTAGAADRGGHKEPSAGRKSSI